MDRHRGGIVLQEVDHLPDLAVVRTADDVGYNAELLINEYVGSAGGLTASQRLHGLRQRNKSEKFSSRREGWMGNMRMWTQIVQSSHPLDRAAYWSYMAGVRVPDADGNLPDRPHLVALGAYPTIGLGAAALRGASRPFR